MGLATFKGGIHPPDKKSLAAGSAISEAKPPKIVVIPLSQHLGAPAKALVTIGQAVKKGEMIGEAGGFVSAPVHASVPSDFRTPTWVRWWPNDGISHPSWPRRSDFTTTRSWPRPTRS